MTTPNEHAPRQGVRRLWLGLGVLFLLAGLAGFCSWQFIRGGVCRTGGSGNSPMASTYFTTWWEWAFGWWFRELAEGSKFRSLATDIEVELVNEKPK